MKLETKKLIKKSILLSPLVIIILILLINFYVEQKTKDYIYDDVDNIPKNEVGLLLGTSKYLTSGIENLYYTYRIQAAVELYENEKIDIIIVSGDNSTKDYNEPVMMMNDLVEKGVKEEDIVLDYAGFRTLDSVVRSKEIFEQNKITIISQRFHNERAIFIAKTKDINAIGYNAKDVNIRYGFKTQIREYLARVKMFFDIAVNKQPKYLGEKILIIK